MTTLERTKEIGLLLTEENALKAINGTKTQTRRVIKGLCGCPDFYHFAEGEPYPYYFRRKDAVWDSFKRFDELTTKYCPYGGKDNRLYLKESTEILEIIGTSSLSAIVRYRDGVELEKVITEKDNHLLWSRKDWKKKASSQFMLKSFARHWLKVESVRIEQLQEISEEDAISEGVSPFDWDDGKSLRPIQAFAKLWDSINLDRGYDWDANPMVWAISFSIAI